MKTIFLVLSILFVNVLNAQIEKYQITERDTIELSDLKFRRVIALQLDEAIVLLDYTFFTDKLKAERKGLLKQINSRQRMIKRKTDYGNITLSQLKLYQKQFVPIDSIFGLSKKTRSDTLFITYKIFEKANSPFGDFLPATLEAKQCMVLDLNNQKQRYIIKQSGNKRTGQMTAVGSSFYFLKGSTRYFLSKMDWVS